MAYIKVEDLPNHVGNYANNCIDGMCSGCGECCVDLLPVTPAEISRIREYVRKHNINEHRQAPFFDLKATDLSCPFRNQQTKKCEVYPARPYICRSFTCAKTREDAIRDRGLVYKERAVHSLRWEIFGNPEAVAFIAAVVTMERKVRYGIRL